MSDIKCFWPSGCADRYRCKMFGGCVAQHQHDHQDELFAKHDNEMSDRERRLVEAARALFVTRNSEERFVPDALGELKAALQPYEKLSVKTTQEGEG